MVEGSESISCPKCGRAMVRRTARRGPRSGMDFWGCSGYPQCKETVAIDPDPTTGGGQAPSAAARKWLLPREIGMEGGSGCQVKAFQSNQQAERIVDAIYTSRIDTKTLTLASQWRLESPRPREGAALDAKMQTLLAVVEKLLTRGSIAYTTPAIEGFIQAHSGVGAFPHSEIAATLYAVAAEPTCPYEPSVFDSDAEEEFAKWFLHQESPWGIVEHIDLSAVLGEREEVSAGRRIDFLLVSPSGNALAVEIDGANRSRSNGIDAACASKLKDLGIEVLRIPASEAQKRRGPNLAKITEELDSLQNQKSGDAALTLPVRLGKLAHQVQVAIVEALLGEWLRVDGPWTIGFEPPVSEVVPSGLAAELAYVAAQDCAELVRRVFRLYDRTLDQFQVNIERNVAAPDIVLSFGDDALPRLVGPRFAVRDICIPGRISAPRISAEPMNADNPERETVRYFLRYLFRKDDFLEGQWETIQRTLRGWDSIVLLPTGGGKSIAFQLSALLRPGCCVVVDPILSLIEDQIDNLAKVGIDRCLEISSAVDREIRDATGSRMAHYLFIYVAPERFQIKEFRDELRALTVSVPISEIAIDEAHCVSEWGHDFRTSYLRLGQNAREYCESQGSTPPVIALTGTASRTVLKTMQFDLNIRAFDALITPKSFDRPELEFTTIKTRVGESISTLMGFLEALPSEFRLPEREFFKANGHDTYSGIVFTSTINTPTGTEEIANRLRRRLSMEIGTYSGGAPRGKGKDWNLNKKATAEKFKHNDMPLLVATNAYGMGIDKPNVRYTIHLGLPHSIESFYQESGRAGRDKQRAVCAVLFATYSGSAQLLHPAVSASEIANAIHSLPRNQQDDLHQALWFHTQTFKGAAGEKRQLGEVVRRLGKIGTETQRIVKWNDDDDASNTERSLHRLSIIGIISDYEKDWSRHLFQIQLAEINKEIIVDKLCAYISEIYLPGRSTSARDRLEEQFALTLEDFAIQAGEELVDFVYEHVEQARRRALFEMVEAASEAASDSKIRGGDVLRSRVLRHLEWSGFDDALEKIIESKHGGLDVIRDGLSRVETHADADSLRGAAARLLESYPDQPALLLLRGVAEALARGANWDVVESSVSAALRSVTAYKSVDQKMVADALASCISTVASADKEAATQVAAAVANSEPLNISTARLILENGISSEVSTPLVLLLAQNLLASANHIREVYNGKQQL